MVAESQLQELERLYEAVGNSLSMRDSNILGYDEETGNDIALATVASESMAEFIIQTHLALPYIINRLRALEKQTRRLIPYLAVNGCPFHNDETHECQKINDSEACFDCWEVVLLNTQYKGYHKE